MQVQTFFIFLACFAFGGCSSKILQVENSDKILKIDDYDKKLNIKEIEQPQAQVEVVEKKSKKSDVKPIVPGLKIEALTEEEKATPKSKLAEKHPKKPEKKHKILPKQPPLEDKVGFEGRRPIVDPFHVGEKVTLKLSYFNVVAGYMTVEVMPFVEVNGRKSYHFRVTGRSNSFFSTFYAVDDSAETFLDYDELIPYNMVVHVKETKQLREVRSYFDWKKMEAKFWEKKITKKDGIEEKNLAWKIEPFAQNVFSAAFYLRTFTLEPGKTVEFRVSDNEKNMVVKGHVVRRDILQTEVGELKTLVIKPEIQIGGIFQPMGDVYFWLTDDDRKLIVRIESKIRIGTITAAVSEIVR